MGAGIAQIALIASCDVLLFDAHPKALEAAGASIAKRINRLAEKERISQDIADLVLSRLQLVSSVEAFAVD